MLIDFASVRGQYMNEEIVACANVHQSFLDFRTLRRSVIDSRRFVSPLEYLADHSRYTLKWQWSRSCVASPLQWIRNLATRPAS